MDTINLTPELLAGLAGTVLSLLFTYVPPLRNWLNAHASNWQASAMLVMLALVSLALFGAACGHFVALSVTCDKPGIVKLIEMFGIALIANQSAYQISPQPKA